MAEGNAERQPPAGNFLFLEAGWPQLSAEASKAERNVFADPRIACFYARRTLELALQWVFDADRALAAPRRRNLSAMLLEPSFVALVEPRVRTKMDLIRREGNAAVHRTQEIDAGEAENVVRELFHVLYWLARTYAPQPELAPAPESSFNLLAVPGPPVPAPGRATPEALRRRAAEDAARDADREQAREQDPALRDKLARLGAEVAAAKAANRLQADPHDYDEQATRDRYIDLLLQESGWPLEDERDREFEVTGMPNESGVGFVDYVLWGDDGRPLGLVEAKRTRRDARAGRQQAKLYADCLEQRFGQRPVIFYSNGYETWLWDDRRYPPRRVQGFYTKEELARLIERRRGDRPLEEAEIDAAIVERPYQHRAIRRIADRFERENQRGALIVMATGAGKTRTAIALIDVLMKAGWVKRVLFLADRTALVNQTVGAFKTHLPGATTVNLVSERDAIGRVYVSTYPTMIGRIGEAEAGAERRFGPGFFDLVVVDEAHRSVYRKYRRIFAYFDSLLLGLTATPKDEVDRNTYGLFGLESGVPTDSYDLDEAVADGYLVPPRAIAVPLKFPLRGLRYDELSEAEREQWEEQDWGDEAEMPDAVGAEAVNSWLFNADTVDKALETLMSHGHKVAGGDRLGKTIIFAKNTEHAEFIVERFDANYPEHAGHFARVITHKSSYAQSLIDDFSTPGKAPHIAVSVDMLDTGIDVPEVVNLVFFKAVRSQTKFLQMLGRGTRLCPDLYGPGRDKRDFLVFDCCDNIAFFNAAIESRQVAPPPSLTERLFGERVELLLRLQSAGAEGDGQPEQEELRKEVAAALRDQVAGINADNFLARPQREWLERYRDPARWAELEPEAAAELVERLAGLPMAGREEDEAAKRFDLIVLGLQLKLLRSQGGVEQLRGQVREIAAGLLEQTAIPAIKERQVLLEELAGEEWWLDVSVAMLESARRRVRGLVRLLEKRKRAVIYTDFRDDLGAVEEVELLGVPGGAGGERFEARARAYLREHEDDPVLGKLRRNLPLTGLDVEQLEAALLAAGVADPADIEGLPGGALGLGGFVRSLVGMEREAAAAAFAELGAGEALSAAQLHFVELVVDHLTANGVIEPSALYESPFTDVAPRGPEGLFAEAEIEQLFEAIAAIGRNAEPQDPPPEAG